MDSLGVSDIESYIIKAYGNTEQALENIGISNKDESVNTFRELLHETRSQLKFSQFRKTLGNENADSLLSEVKLLNNH